MKKSDEEITINILLNRIVCEETNVLYFEKYFNEYTSYKRGFKDKIFLNFLKNNLHRFKSLIEVRYYPENVIDISFLREIKTLKHIHIPIEKIKSLSFIIELPELITIGSFLDKLSNYTMQSLKRRIKYRKNIKKFLQ